MSIRAKTIARVVALLGMAGASAAAFGQFTYKVEEMPAGKGAARAVAIDWGGRILVNLDKPTGQTISLLCSTDGCTKLEPKGKSVSYLAMFNDGVSAIYAGSAKYGDADWAVRLLPNGTTERLVKGTARGIDYDGRTVVGETAAGRAFYFDDGLHFVPTLGGRRGIAATIVGRTVIGASQTAQGSMRATSYVIDDDRLEELGVLPGGDASMAYAVGSLVGGCANDSPGSPALRPVVFQISEVTRLRAKDGPEVQGCVLSADSYDFVGWMIKPFASETRAAAHASEGWTDLNEMTRAKDQKSYTLLVATGINYVGQISATARRHSDGATVAVLLTRI